jgi:hypothetical protein
MTELLKKSPVLRAVGKRYRASVAGRTGQASGDFLVDYRELLKSANATDGEALEEARRDLRSAAKGSEGRLVLDTHPRDASLILRIRLAHEGGEAWLFQLLGELSPQQERARLAKVFRQAMSNGVPDAWAERWQNYCARLAENAEGGGVIAPFDRGDASGNEELLGVLSRVLSWQGESLIRFGSCVICGDSKRLEQLRVRLEVCLAQLSENEQGLLEDFGLLEKPRSVLVQGPMVLEFPGGCLDVGQLRGAVSLSEIDVNRAAAITTTATRVLTVENETTFLELAKLGTDTLLIHTSYPGRGVRALFARLPTALECWHFGDTDPSGYDILRQLRMTTGRAIQPLHMKYREEPRGPELSTQDQRTLTRLINDPLMGDLKAELDAVQAAGHKGAFEQESLGQPKQQWPFY